MQLKGALELIEDLVRYVKPPQGCAISLTERDPRGHKGANWEAGVKHMPLAALTRYDSAVQELHRQHPIIDWTGITEFDGDNRRVARWLSEVGPE